MRVAMRRGSLLFALWRDTPEPRLGMQCMQARPCQTVSAAPNRNAPSSSGAMPSCSATGGIFGLSARADRQPSAGDSPIHNGIGDGCGNDDSLFSGFIRNDQLPRSKRLGRSPRELILTEAEKPEPASWATRRPKWPQCEPTLSGQCSYRACTQQANKILPPQLDS